MLSASVESYQVKDEYEILVKQPVHDALICVLID